MNGEIVFMKFFELGALLDLTKARQFISEQKAPSLKTERAMPDYVSFEKPLYLEAFSGKNEFLSIDKNYTVRVLAMAYGIGVVGIILRFNFEAAFLKEVKKLPQVKFLVEGNPLSLDEMASGAFSLIKPHLTPALIEVYNVIPAPEAYTVFAFRQAGEKADDFLGKNKAGIAGLLGNVTYPEKLSSREIDDILRCHFSFYDDDLVVADWDSGLVIEPVVSYEDILFIFEMANIQLLELRTYDAYLDGILDKAYDDLDSIFSRRWPITSTTRRVINTLAEIRIDMAKVKDYLANLSKFFGDWYLAKLYLGLSDKFHLSKWEKSIDDKLSTLNDLYSMANQEETNRQNIILEAMIVVLFIIDLIILMVLAK